MPKSASPGAVDSAWVDRATRRSFLLRSAGVAASMAGTASVLSACGSAQSGVAATQANGAGVTGSPPSAPSGTLTVAMPSAPATLDPSQAVATGDFTFEAQVFDTLTTFEGSSSNLVGMLATSWVASPDARTWTVKLRQGVKFHDGTPFDASAVRANFEYFAKSQGFISFVMPKFARIDDSTPDSITVVLASPTPDFMRNLSFAGIISPKAIAAGPAAINRHPVGTGPYMFGSRSATALNLKRNPDYWDKGPYFDEIVLQVMPDEASRISALRTGQVDVVGNVSAALLAGLQGVSGVQLVTNPTTWSTANLALRSDVAPTNDIRVRQAIGYALDTAVVAKAIYRGTVKPDPSYMAPGVVGYQPASPAITHDPERAKQLLASVGRKVTLNTAVPTGQIEQLQALQAFADQWRSVGFNVNVDQLEEGVFNTQTSSPTPKHQVFSTGHPWATGGPIIFEVGLVDSDSAFDKGMPPAAVKQKNALLSKVMTTPDGPARVQAIGALQNLYAQRVAIIPLYYLSVTDAISSKLRDYAVPRNSLGTPLAKVFRT